jgi:hypothetical protein
MGSPNQEFSERVFKLSISLPRLLFGAIALNLMILICIIIALGTTIIASAIYVLLNNSFPALVVFFIVVGAIAIMSQLVQFFAWGARGFLEDRKPIRIGAMAAFFTLYGIAGVKTGTVDGYVALGTVAATLCIVVAGHLRDKFNA